MGHQVRLLFRLCDQILVCPKLHFNSSWVLPVLPRHLRFPDLSRCWLPIPFHRGFLHYYYSVVRVSEVLGTLPANLEQLCSILSLNSVSLTEFLTCVGAESSTSRSTPTPAPETGSSDRERYLVVKLARWRDLYIKFPTNLYTKTFGGFPSSPQSFQYYCSLWLIADPFYWPGLSVWNWIFFVQTLYFFLSIYFLCILLNIIKNFSSVIFSNLGISRHLSMVPNICFVRTSYKISLYSIFRFFVTHSLYSEDM